MIVTPIKFSNIAIHPRKQNRVNIQSDLSFGNRPEYQILQRECSNPRYSYFFRRDMPGKYQDVIDAVKLVYKQVKKPKILIVGVGRGEEPCSYLAVINEINNDKPLGSVVDLSCIDLQPKIQYDDLRHYAYLESYGEPKFAPNSFRYDRIRERHGLRHDIFEFLVQTFNNPDKTKWDTTVEEFSQNCKPNCFNLISINKVLMYLKDKETQSKVMNNLLEALKPKGILVTDIVYDNADSNWTLKRMGSFKKLSPGIWQKPD